MNLSLLKPQERKPMRRSPLFFLCTALILGFSSNAYAQEDEYVTVQEFDDAMEELDALQSKLNQVSPGTTNFLVTGFATTGYTDTPSANSSFAASFSPIFLWTLNERTFFESEIELDTGGETESGYAQLNYEATDYLTIGAGKFLAPFGIFTERIHPSWINRLPNAPLVAGHSGLSPSAIVGAQARGAIAAGNGKVNYSLFIGNGSQLNDGSDEEEEAGLLHWDTGADVDQNKTVGARVGWIPMAGLEIGTSFLSGKTSGAGTSESQVDVTLFGFDITAQREIAALKGNLRFEGEYVSSSVSDATFFPGTPDATTFSNDRSGGYGQLAFRPTKSESAMLRDTEFVTRYDWLDQPAGAPQDEKTTRWTFGLDYWLGPSTVLKIAADQLEVDSEPSVSSFYLQLAIGF
jgi:hypothetical protein